MRELGPSEQQPRILLVGSRSNLGVWSLASASDDGRRPMASPLLLYHL